MPLHQLTMRPRCPIAGEETTHLGGRTGPKAGTAACVSCKACPTLVLASQSTKEARGLLWVGALPV